MNKLLRILIKKVFGTKLTDKKLKINQLSSEKHSWCKQIQQTAKLLNYTVYFLNEFS